MCILATKYNYFDVKMSAFYEKLSYVNASRANRLDNARFVKSNMHLFPELMQIMFKVNDKVSCHAAWVFEFVCADKISVLLPYADYFITHINTVYMDAAVRPVSKVCVMLIQHCTIQQDANLKDNLTQKHKEQLMETAFDWLIGNQKVVPKVHAMEVLFLLGCEPHFKWVHPELIQILERDFNTHSAAYKSRAKRIFKRLQKQGHVY